MAMCNRSNLNINAPILKIVSLYISDAYFCCCLPCLLQIVIRKLYSQSARKYFLCLVELAAPVSIPNLNVVMRKKRLNEGLLSNQCYTSFFTYIGFVKQR